MVQQQFALRVGGWPPVRPAAARQPPKTSQEIREVQQQFALRVETFGSLLGNLLEALCELSGSNYSGCFAIGDGSQSISMWGPMACDG